MTHTPENPNPNNGTIEAILDDHENSHGDFNQASVVAQTLKRILRQTPNWEKLHPAQKEALEMDMLKTARILCGNHAFCDHWDDKAGYAKLGSRACAAATNDTSKPPELRFGMPEPRKELEARAKDVDPPAAPRTRVPDLTPAIDEALRATKPAVPYTLPSATKFKTNTEPRPGQLPQKEEPPKST